MSTWWDEIYWRLSKIIVTEEIFRKKVLQRMIFGRSHHFRNQRGHLRATVAHLSSVLRIFHIWSSSLDWSGMLAASISPSWDPSWLMLAASGSILFFSSSEKKMRGLDSVSSTEVMEFDGRANSGFHRIILDKPTLFVLLSPDAASTSSPLFVQQQTQSRPKRIRTPWRASAENAK